MILATTNPPTPNERLAEWRQQYDRLPIELQAKTVRHFDFRPVREPVDPDAYLLRSA